MTVIKQIQVANVKGFSAVLKCEDGDELRWQKLVWIPNGEQDEATSYWNKYAGRFRYTLSDIKALDRKPGKAIHWRAA